ncbi:Domain of uncharacterised function (DUF3842) [Clostridium putrefaciens]|uniref:Domain of uncharacterized function (DUF3842) n=1 Tax=Clostridium putrefaciens TaxID=99675 RepID=A0A381J6X3_9CLOT|nr:DUF3842 family protein [Clostridium putrefaciens]SUY46865.1 Domain of uncharacterised function (DUF3842) [Clostridium putrefaciens]
MKIAVIDAQGAGLGQTVIKRIRKEIPKEIYIIGLGTNTIATSNMVRAGANVGITGEKAICSFCDRQNINCIIGPIGVICNGGINSEIPASITQYIFQMDCIKYIIPLRNHNVFIPGTRNLEIKEIINEIIIDIKETLII